MTLRPVMIMAGGTGGHVYPGLAVAERLAERHQSVVWLGTRKGLEASAVPAAGIPIEWITIAGIRRRGIGAWALAPFRLLLALAQALRVLRRRRPIAVLGMGGFVSGPGGLAACMVRVPLVIHEQNAVVGTTNRWLARCARQVFEGFAGSFPARAGARWIGNPVRRSILAVPAPRERFAARERGAPLRLLVLGGSQGAASLNRIVPEASAAMPAALRPEIRHQAGRGLADARAAYVRAAVAADVVAFIDDMADAYAWADLVVARAGALTIAELAASGVGAILIPYPYAVDDHQTRNAERFTANGAGLVIAEQELDAARLAAELTALANDRARLLGLALRAREHARQDAAQLLAAACLGYAEGAS
jgi:UDP-N-acetylglucosamine--N-acetylmuramyl-(pentapeptide) pyrophosphoryl-undecaprenol N-acetylglucosamine transferase